MNMQRKVAILVDSRSYSLGNIPLKVPFKAYWEWRNYSVSASILLECFLIIFHYCRIFFTHISDLNYRVWGDAIMFEYGIGFHSLGKTVKNNHFLEELFLRLQC